ncbi:hypothetical protein HPB51_021829 [Rhipicephalus microplus]|uniref:Transcriptional adapter n=1 Tax=Rhipicephalus microplus TaxID=6941 RepID=A0A9J6E3L5_RHIMP|nr:hypothetical protein HPB51_021829 [Rhipicephalus microplus]
MESSLCVSMDTIVPPLSAKCVPVVSSPATETTFDATVEPIHLSCMKKNVHAAVSCARAYWFVGVIAKYHCNYCQEDITGVRVKCAECPDFDLCLQCFSCGAEMGAHKNRHGYQLIDCGNFPIFQAPCNWKAKEELVLLEAIEQYGFGNWEDVSQCLPARSCEEVQEHYNNHYIEGNIGRATWSTEVAMQIKDHTVPEGGPLSPSLSTPVATVDIASNEQQELGYMPCRDDYEREYDNEAESLISQLSMGGPDEDDLEVALKLAQVDMYSRRLRERMRRKGLAREYRLLEQFCHAGRPASKASPVSRSKKPVREADKELQEKMRIFSQFQSATEHEQLLENLEREKELKARIKELLRYRRNGITKLDVERTLQRQGSRTFVSRRK